MHQCWVIGPEHIEKFRTFRANFGVAVLEIVQSDPTLACTDMSPDDASVIPDETCMQSRRLRPRLQAGGGKLN